MTRSPFLRWSLVNAACVAALLAAAGSYNGDVHTAGKLAAAAVLLVFVLASAKAGALAWQGNPSWANEDLGEAADMCPQVGLLGTVAGFLIAFSGDTGQVQERVLGASTALTATFTGIACMIALRVLRRALR